MNVVIKFIGKTSSVILSSLGLLFLYCVALQPQFQPDKIEYRLDLAGADDGGMIEDMINLGREKIVSAAKEAKVFNGQISVHGYVRQRKNADSNQHCDATFADMAVRMVTQKLILEGGITEPIASYSRARLDYEIGNDENEVVIVIRPKSTLN